ncbi:DUF6907 domain-containing protein [Nakamurella leprariae]|uniref:Uncharacterized protein n=1 Tax=Nakamurella leprariae TaxID=2803911 RepID=A0A938YDY9_9ACTN|nr:hypothetical protein [Nakamurella leprariae]MBM9466100.1 hypothetical protein [Nakamurella leprariae]
MFARTVPALPVQRPALPTCPQGVPWCTSHTITRDVVGDVLTHEHSSSTLCLLTASDSHEMVSVQALQYEGMESYALLEMKVDGRFVAELQASEARAVAASLLHLADVLDQDATEGVEVSR